MINFSFSIDIPFSNRWKTLWNKQGRVGDHKSWEFNGYQTALLIELDFGLSFRGDHAGLRTTLGLLGYSVEFHFYDTRHWNFETNTWVKYD